MSDWETPWTWPPIHTYTTYTNTYEHVHMLIPYTHIYHIYNHIWTCLYHIYKIYKHIWTCPHGYTTHTHAYATYTTYTSTYDYVHMIIPHTHTHMHIPHTQTRMNMYTWLCHPHTCIYHIYENIWTCPHSSATQHTHTPLEYRWWPVHCSGQPEMSFSVPLWPPQENYSLAQLSDN